MTVNKYILNEQGEPVAEPFLLKWAEWMDANDRYVANDSVGPYRVKTFFLGVDFNQDRLLGPRPHLFETLAFDQDRECVDVGRFSTRAEALAGHADMCKRMRERISPAKVIPI